MFPDLIFLCHQQPIPLELLQISAPEDPAANANKQAKQRQALVRRSSFNREHGPSINLGRDVKGAHWINFMYLGRKSYNLILWAPTSGTHRNWLENISKQQQAMRERSLIFDTVTLSDGFFSGPNKVNCAAPFSE